MPLPPEITVEDQWPDSVRWRLPLRPLGSSRLIGLPLIAVGGYTAACVVGLVSLATSIAFNWQPIRIPGMFVIGFLLGLTTRGGLTLIWWGLGILCGRREIVVTGAKLRTVERIGPLWYGKSWPINSIRRIHTSAISETQANPTWLANWNALLLTTTLDKRGMLAWGYPLEWLQPLAQHVAEQADRAVALLDDGATEDQGKILVGDEPSPSITDADGDFDDEDDDLDEEFDDDEIDDDAPLTQPAGSLIEFEQFDDGLTIKVPPAGLWRGTSGMFFFALLWNGFIFLFTVCAGVAYVKGNVQQQADGDGAWIALLVFGLFYAVGIFVMVTALNMGLRKAAIALAGDVLMVIQSGPFGTQRREWPVGELVDIKAGASGIQVNDVDVLELQIVGTDQKKFGLLCGRKDDELYWLADVLRRATGLDEPPADFPAEAPAPPPPA